MATFCSTTDENSYVPVQFQKNTGRIGGKLKPQHKDSTRLQELSLMNTHFGAIHSFWRNPLCYTLRKEFRLHNK